MIYNGFITQNVYQPSSAPLRRPSASLHPSHCATLVGPLTRFLFTDFLDFWHQSPDVWRFVLTSVVKDKIISAYIDGVEVGLSVIIPVLMNFMTDQRQTAAAAKLCSPVFCGSNWYNNNYAKWPLWISWGSFRLFYWVIATCSERSSCHPEKVYPKKGTFYGS